MLCRRAARGQRRRGMVAAFAAVSFTVLLAAAALSMDGGALMTERRHAQETADAAALAAADDLFQHFPLAGHGGKDPNGTAAKSARTVAAANGYSNDGTTSTVTVNIPPKSGPYTDATRFPGYVEVIVNHNQPPGLSSILSVFGQGGGSGPSAGGPSRGTSSIGTAGIPVGARAVARGLWVPANPQIIVFDLTSAAALLVTNQGPSETINVQGGPVIVNSSDPAAASNTTPANFIAPSYQITGGVLGSFNGPKSFGTRPQPDPLSYLPVPTSNVSGQPLTVQSGGNAFYNNGNPPPNPLPEGIYQGGITVTGSASLTLQPNGTYVMQGGGFTFNSSGNLTGNGVLIYNQPASTDAGLGFYINNQTSGSLLNPGPPGVISLSPLTAGPYQGITLFQQQSGTNPILISGSGGVTITGTVYAANASVSVRIRSNSGHNDVGGTQFMSRYLLFSGDSDFTMSQIPQPSRQRKIGLVE